MSVRSGLAISALFSIFFLVSCRAAFAPARPRWPPTADGFFMHVGAFLQVTGTAKERSEEKSQSKRRAESRDDAIRDAWARLLDYIHGLPLAGYGFVKTRAEEEPEFGEKIEAFVYAAPVVETRRSGGAVAVVIRVEKSRINQILETHFQ